MGSLAKRFEQWKWRTIHGRLQRERRRFYKDPAFARRAFHHPHFARLGDWLPSDDPASTRILELGCGDGRFVALLDGLGFRVTAVDPHAYATWAEFVDRPGVEFRDDVRAESLPFDDESFDAVVCLGALLYFEDPGQALGEIARVLKPRGRLVLRTVNRLNLYTRRTGQPLDPASKHLYSETELQTVIEGRGFEVAETFSFGFWPSVVPRLWWLISNTLLTPAGHAMLSSLTPRDRRINVVAFASKDPE